MQQTPPPALESGPAGAGLLRAVNRELATATAALPERQREALALRERETRSYAQMSATMGISDAAIALLLARARLRLREELRGVPTFPGPACAQRDRALRSLARRQDAEPLSESDALWLSEHLDECDSCTRAHAAMLEASVCYRAALVPPGGDEADTSDSRPGSPAPGDAGDALPDGRGASANRAGSAAERAGSSADASGSVASPEPAPHEAIEAGKRKWWDRFRAGFAADARR